MLAYRKLHLALPLALAAATGVLALSAPAGAQPAKRPQPYPKAQNDGCQRSVGGLVTGNSPAWVYVNRDRRAKFVKGTAFNSHFFGDDLTTNHIGYDYNVDIQPDKAYANFVGGDPTKKTGNFEGESGDGERVGALHSEWENQVMRTFMVASERDRVQVWGGWIWDCAHWNDDFSDNGAADPGERTEFHAIRAMVVERKNRYGGRHGETQADAFISSEGNRAHASAECALTHHPIDGDQYDPGYKTCMQNPKNARQPVNDMDYTFFVSAPDKPSSDARIAYSVVTKVPGGPPETVRKTAHGILVTVKFKGFGGSTETLRYGKRFRVGWDDSDVTAPHLQVKLGKLTIVHSLDPGPPDPPNHQTSTPPGEYVMFLEVNGDWFRLNTLFPGLTSVSDGQTFTIGKTVDLYLPRNRKLRVYGQGWECDISIALLPCPAGRNEVALFNDPIGDKIDELSLSKAPGSHTLKSPAGNWTLGYTVVRK